MVPQNTRGDAAPGPPLFADVHERRRIRTRTETLYIVDRGLKGDIADGPDVGTHQGHEQINVGGPEPDPLYLHQLRAHVIFIHPPQPVHAQRPVQHAFRQMADISGLLAADSGGAELVVAKRQHLFRSKVDRRRRQPVIRRPRRGERNLLFQDQQNQRREPPGPPPDGRFPEFLDDRAQIGVPVC